MPIWTPDLHIDWWVDFRNE